MKSVTDILEVYSMETPLTDVKAYNAIFADEFANETRNIVLSGRYILGGKVVDFENAVANYIGTSHCVGVASGTDALEVVFSLLELSPDDEIVIQANAYIACALGTLRSPAKLRIIDCAPNGTFDIDNLLSVITPNTKAVLVVHLYGDCCDMNRLVDVCSTNSLTLIEDCAQSFGSSYSGKMLGSFGFASCHSFYPTKNLGAIGDAGAVCTNDSKFASKLQTYRNLGSPAKYINTIKGTNARLDALQAAFLSIKLPSLNDAIIRKIEISGLYQNILKFKHVKNSDPNVNSSYHLYVIYIGESRDKFVEHMTTGGIETIIHYPIPFYKSQAYSELNHLEFKNAEMLSRGIVSIPMHPLLSDETIRKIGLHINAFEP